MLLEGKRILLGVTGSIAAYKSAHLTRLLVKEGAEVKIIMSTSALDFITPLTLATLSKNPVVHKFQDEENGVWNNHVELGLWADLFVIAPLSANTLSKFSNGICDNLLSAIYLSARCPIMLAPAMDLDMYQHPSVLNNFDKIRSYGNQILEAEHGELASGLVGQGRMMEPENIVKQIVKHFDQGNSFNGSKVMITSGPTQEPIDPVRFISNHSSGKMGSAMAMAFAKKGAEVHLILGEGAQKPIHPNIKIYPVRSAQEMFQKADSIHPDSDICVFTAAVADYSPQTPSAEKIKKEDDFLILDLIKNIDIALSLGKKKQINQRHIGFALETDNGAIQAKSKLVKKNFDIIVLNSMQDEGAGFKHDTNKVTLFFKDGREIKTEVMPKDQIAEVILAHLKSLPVQI